MLVLVGAEQCMGNIYAPEEDEDWTYKLEVVYFQILFFPLLLKIYVPLR